MGATWTFDQAGEGITFVDRASRIISVAGTRTLDGASKLYRLASFHVAPGEALADEADRAIAALVDTARGDSFWKTPDLTTLFPNAASVLKTKADAVEVARG